MYTYYIWLTVLTPLYEDKIIAYLVKNDYSVEKSGDLMVQGKNSPSAIISLKLKHNNFSTPDVLREIADGLKPIIKYHSMILIDDRNNSAWCGGNIIFNNPIENQSKVDLKIN